MAKRVLYSAVYIVFVLSTSVFGGVRADEASGMEESSIDLTVRSDESLSGPEQIQWVEEKTRIAREIYSRVQSMLDKAREEKETLKITCLDDKLTQISVSLRGIEERSETLKLAVKGGDVATANQQFAILKIYFSRIFGLNAEAENCLGESDIVLGKTETTVEFTGNVDIDPTASEDSGETVDTPEHASGYY